MPLDGRNGAAGLVWAVERVESPLAPDRVKKQLCVGAARCLPSGFRSEVSAWLECYDRVLLAPARCAHLPPRARESVQPGRGGRAKSPHNTPVAGSDDAEARRAARRRCRGFAQSCGSRWASDQGRSDPCSRHQQGSCGRYACVSVRLHSSFVEVQFRIFISQNALLQEKPRTPSHSIRLLGWPLIVVPGAVQPVVPLCRGRVVVASI